MTFAFIYMLIAFGVLNLFASADITNHDEKEWIYCSVASFLWPLAGLVVCFFTAWEYYKRYLRRKYKDIVQELQYGREYNYAKIPIKDWVGIKHGVKMEAFRISDEHMKKIDEYITNTSFEQTILKSDSKE